VGVVGIQAKAPPPGLPRVRGRSVLYKGRELADVRPPPHAGEE